MSLVVEEFDPSDDEAMLAWYDSYRAAQIAGREYHSAFAFEEIRAMFRGPRNHQDRVIFQATLDGVVVGTAGVTFPLADNTEMAGAGMGVRPGFRNRGIGSALLTRMEEAARAHGRTVILGQAAYPLSSPVDGTGDAAVQFLTNRGFTFGLGDVQRVLPLPISEDLLTSLIEQAEPAHEGYRFTRFEGPVPQEIIASYGVLIGSLMTEAPTGDIEREPEAYDETRIRDEEVTLVEAGRTRFSTVALSPEGEAVGYTEFVVPAYEPGRVYQWGTLVRPDHRGHKLGLALKARNLQWLQGIRPDLTLVRTWNAEVNEHMVSVNDALGFRPVDREGEFQKKL